MESTCKTAVEGAERTRTAVPDRTWVYFIQAGTNGPVKIGTADSPRLRCEHFQTGNHRPLSVVHKFRGSIEDEHALHELFTDLHVRGEWFRARVLELLPALGLMDEAA